MVLRDFNAWLDTQLGGIGGRHLVRVWGALSKDDRLIVRHVLREVQDLATAGSSSTPPKTADWLARRGLTDTQWRAMKDLAPGALAACAIACALDRGQLRSIVMLDVGVFPRKTRSGEPGYVPDRVAVGDAALAVRGEIAIIALTPTYDLVRFNVRDVPLGGLQDATGSTFLDVMTEDLRTTIAKPGTPLNALGLSDVPVFVRRGPTIGISDGRPVVAARVGVDQLPAVRRELEISGLQYLARLEDGRSPLMADLAPVRRTPFGHFRAEGGPRVVLRKNVARKLRSRQLPGADNHRFSLDDHAFDGESFLGVYRSGFGLPSEHGYFEAAAIAAYQTGSPELYLIGGWDLRELEARTALAAAVHFASVPELRQIVEDCRRRGRGSVDQHRPALRDPTADAVAAEVEHVCYALVRLDEIGSARSSAS